MLQRSPRRKLFNDYARQLMKRYPTMREEIQARSLRVNTQWEEIEKAMVPGQGDVGEEEMLKSKEWLDCFICFNVGNNIMPGQGDVG